MFFGRLGFRVEHADRRKGDVLARGAAQRDVQGIGAHDLELQRVLFGLDIQRPAVGLGQVLGFQQDFFHQTVDVALRRQGDADVDQPLKIIQRRIVLRRGCVTGHIVQLKPLLPAMSSCRSDLPSRKTAES